MSEEEQLPNELNKLEISNMPMPQIKLPTVEKLPVSLNPFYVKSNTEKHRKERALHDLFGTVGRCNCRSRIRRNSESVLEDTRSTITTEGTSIERTIINSTQFKHKYTASLHNRRRFVLREPILKSIQRCFHSKNGTNCLRSTSRNESHAGPSSVQLGGNATLEALNLDDSRTSQRFPQECSRESRTLQLATTSSNIKSNSILDFRSLIEECNSLVDVSRGTPSSSSKSLGLQLNKKNSKNFSTIQSADSRSKAHRTRHSTGSISHQHRNSNNCASSTSCSQQARINPNSPSAAAAAAVASSSASAVDSTCDVTIDELASYFETFVHIPKKMSSMAEMMYI